MTHQEHPTVLEQVLELLTEHGFDGMADACRVLYNEAMKIERADTLQAQPYERTEGRRGYANGFKPKTVQTRLGPMTLAIPQTRGVAFYPQAIERGERSERALKLALAEMYVQGVSTHEVSSSQVSRAAEALDEELDQWRNRPLGETPYLILDARYEKVRHGGSVVDCAVLIAIGLLPDGKRSILGVSVSLSEAEVHWRQFLESLQTRGLHGVRLIVSDNHAGLKAARQARFAGVPWQRCQFHLQQNAVQYVPKVSMRSEVAADLRAIFDASDLPSAERLLQKTVQKYQSSAPKLAEWIEANLPEALTVFRLPPSHRKRLRTSNMLERLNQELKRRTRVATLFPNERSLLRLVSAVLSEVSEDWETGKVYLNMQAE